MSDLLTLEERTAPLIDSENEIARVWQLYRLREPVHVMFLLRRNRRKLDQALRVTGVMETEDLCALTKAVCALADAAARYAQVPTAPKPKPSGKTSTKPALIIES